MARSLRLIHVPGNVLGESRLVPVESLGDTSALLAWANSARVGDVMTCFTVVDARDEAELDRLATEVRGAEADAVADNASTTGAGAEPVGDSR